MNYCHQRWVMIVVPFWLRSLTLLLNISPHFDNKSSKRTSLRPSSWPPVNTCQIMPLLLWHIQSQWTNLCRRRLRPSPATLSNLFILRCRLFTDSHEHSRITFVHVFVACSSAAIDNESALCPCSWQHHWLARCSRVLINNTLKSWSSAGPV